MIHIENHDAMISSGKFMHCILRKSIQGSSIKKNSICSLTFSPWKDESLPYGCVVAFSKISLSLSPSLTHTHRDIDRYMHMKLPTTII